MNIINTYLKMTQKLLDDLYKTQSVQKRRLQQLPGYENLVLKTSRKKSGATYYKVKCINTNSINAKSMAMDYSSSQAKSQNNKIHYRYLGKSSSEEVNNVKEAHFLKVSLKVIEQNIKCLLFVLKLLKPFDRSSINSMLPKVYRNANINISQKNVQAAKIWKETALKKKEKYPAPHPEHLRHKTADGTLVRSKSEVIIYNFLLSQGIIFVYEMPIETQDCRILWPDFTILSEIDYETLIFIEHQSMMDVPEYRDNFGNRVYLYLREGYVPYHDVFFTFDSDDVGVNASVFQEIIDTKVRPIMM